MPSIFIVTIAPVIGSKVEPSRIVPVNVGKLNEGLSSAITVFSRLSFPWKGRDYNSLSFTIDLNKLLVPTPPIYNTNGEIIKGKKDDVSVPRGIFQSFSDAPDGFSEEIKEVSYSFGFEYWYSKTFAGRMGYFTESNEKGGRRYMTFGLGLNIKSFTFDFAYLITTTQSNPLQNTIRFSLGFYLDNSKK